MSDFEQLKPCPFCGSHEISPGEISGLDFTGNYSQTECGGCGACGPEARHADGEIDYGDLKSIEAWNTRAAIASMQGEAVAKIVYDRKTDEKGNTYHKSRPQIWPLISDSELLAYPQSTQLFTHAPDSAARIAEQDARIKELEQQLAKLEVNHSLLRKHVRMAIDIKSMSDECYDFLTAAIRQIGGAE